MDLFDIIGPVMVGPSSSHTAGAARIGKITRMLLGSRPVSARIGLYGSFQKTYLGHGTDKALIGGLLGMNVDDSRLRDSLRLAAEAKLEYSFYNADVRGAHPNTVILDVDGDDGGTFRCRPRPWAAEKSWSTPSTGWRPASPATKTRWSSPIMIRPA